MNILLNLSELSDQSLQGQIVDQIRAKVLTGFLPAGTALPSIRMLASQNQVSVITVQKAYEKLCLEGFIHSRRSKGYFVSEISPEQKKGIMLERFESHLTPSLKQALAEGLEKEEIVKVFDRIIAKI